MSNVDEKQQGVETPPKSDSSINPDDYSSILADALKKKDEEISALKKSSAENTRRLTEMIVNERKPSENSQTVVHTDKEIDELKKRACSTQLCDMEIAAAMVEWFDACKERGLETPFVPNGIKISPTPIDEYRSEQTIESLRECLKIADGNKEIFKREQNRLMKGR